MALSDLCGRNLHLLICCFLDREIVVPRANCGQSFARTEAAARDGGQDFSNTLSSTASDQATTVGVQELNQTPSMNWFKSSKNPLSANHFSAPELLRALRRIRVQALVRFATMAKASAINRMPDHREILSKDVLCVLKRFLMKLLT
jgi:hypothetical protein